MKHVIPAALAIGLFATGAAVAQTTAAPVPARPVPAQTAPMATTPMTPAQTSAGKSTSSAPAAVSTADNPRTTAAPVAGANSFTESQARVRLQEKGFGNVSNLKKDDKGVWRATAMKDGKSAPVSLDYQGNVVSN